MPPSRTGQRPHPADRRPTMTDVAQAAGVSQSTVSMVLNQMEGARLSAATRAKVMSVALALGYQLPRRAVAAAAAGAPGGLASGLASGLAAGMGIAPAVGFAGQGGLPAPGALAADAAAAGARAPGAVPRNLIGYLVDEISTSPHPVVSVDGARDAAWAHDCIVSVAVTRGNAEQEAAAIAGLRAHPGLLGIVYSTIFTREVRLPEALLDLPVVLLNCHDELRRKPAIVPGEVAGGHAATEHLIAAGHRRIGFINGEPWMEAAQDRLKGYRRALATADLPYDAALVRHGDWMAGTGYTEALALLALERPPTAIFAANDLMALGVLEALRERGRRVPEDVAVIGYDDQEISRHTRPPLTTMVLPNYEMGRAAVEALMAQLAEGAGAGADTRTRRLLVKIDCPLVERETVHRRGRG